MPDWLVVAFYIGIPIVVILVLVVLWAVCLKVVLDHYAK
jgi:hypothetical protein